MISPSNLLRRTRRLAFTLIELLVVITVISLLLAFSAPALFDGLQSSRLSGAGERMVSALSEAQQTAFSRNTAVEIQFYRYDGMFGDPAFRSYRLFTVTNPPNVNSETTNSLGAITNLPEGVIISTDSGLSPSLSANAIEDTLQNSGVPNAQYIALRFLPDGTCRRVATNGAGLAVLEFLPLNQSFFTMIEDNGKVVNTVDLPDNFYTIQTDPYTGKSRSYRPGF
jgi:uncharacterized protein (TIGR02596 family)